MDMCIAHGVKYIWYFHYMPVGNAASPELLLTPQQREYMYHRVREIRGFKGGKPVFAVDFQNDGEFIHGCIAGGKYYCHINPNGDVEPCVFIHYSQANIHDKSLLECFQQPLFKAYQEGQPLMITFYSLVRCLKIPRNCVKLLKRQVPSLLIWNRQRTLNICAVNVTSMHRGGQLRLQNCGIDDVLIFQQEISGMQTGMKPGFRRLAAGYGRKRESATAFSFFMLKFNDGL